LPGSRSSAQLTDGYKPEELVGRLVVAVVNFQPRQIGAVVSDVLTLGVPDSTGAVVLLAPDADVPLGGRVSGELARLRLRPSRLRLARP